MNHVTITLENEDFGTIYSVSIPADQEDLYKTVEAFRSVLLAAGYLPEKVDDVVPHDDRGIIGTEI